eukprot:442537_1
MLRVVRGVSCCNAAFDILVQSCCCTTGFMPNIACSNLLLYHQYGAKSVFRVVKPFSTTTTSDNKSYNYSSSTFSFPPIRVAIVGAGPAGFYTAKYLLKGTAQLEKFGNEGVHIDLLDRLPTPFGLVRSGVAPDHPEVKNVQTHFSEIAEHPRVNFRGNVKVGAATSGTGLSLSDLMKAYHCVVLAYGAESSKELTIPGAHLRGVISARDFVGWYNGHPDFAHLSEVVTEGLSHPSGNMAVIGVGNVALDCARILAKGGSSLAHTDCAAHALEVLTPDLPPSSRRRIWVLGRRGHAQASFTIKELRELTRIPTTDFVVRDDELQAGRGEESSAALQERPRQRIEKVLNEAAAKASSSSSSDANSNKTEVSLRFLVSPVRVVGDGKGSVSGLDIERNQLVSGEGRVVGIRGMGELEHFPCGLVLVSIGYRTLPLHGVPFDHRRGIICNKHGRVQGLQGVYCSGWAKRGPTGIIATNILDAKDTVKSIVDDLKGELVQGLRTVKPGWNGLKDTVRSAAVGWEQYKCIDEAEVALGVSCGKPREKIVSRSDLLRAAKKGGASLIG